MERKPINSKQSINNGKEIVKFKQSTTCSNAKESRQLTVKKKSSSIYNNQLKLKRKLLFNNGNETSPLTVKKKLVNQQWK